MIIRCKINVSKIEKAKLFAGKSGTYLDCTLLENKNGTDQYGNDFMIVQDISKAEREAGKRGQIIGNGKFFGVKESPQGNAAPKPASQPDVVEGAESTDSDVPF